MNSNPSFWSKGTNRAIVYGIGFVILFGSYVIGSPNSARQQKAKKMKLAATVSDNSQIQDLEEAFHEEKEEAVPSDDITPSAVIKPTSSIQPSSLSKGTDLERLNAGETFNPFTDREMSESEKQATRKELSAKTPIDYPYEVSKEELDLYDKYEEGKAEPEEKKNLIASLMSFRPKEKKMQKKVGDGSASDETKANNSTSKNRLSSSVSTWFNGTKSKQQDETKEESENTVKDEDIVGGLKYGTSDNQDVWYESHPRTALPPYLNFTHENLKIYQFNAGTNAGIIPSTYTGVKQLYARVDAKLEKAFHEQYRLPPDWSIRYRFNEDPGEEAKIARFVSNKMVYSLGTNGSVIFEVTKGAIVNKPGIDFMLWSNPFCYLNTPEGRENVSKSANATYESYTPYSGTVATTLDDYAQCRYDTAKVYVSAKGPEGPWEPIDPCYKGIPAIGSACAGYGLNLWHADPSYSNITKGGDKYDLEKNNLEMVKAIKIVDLGNQGHVLQAGYDLDAIAIINYQP